MKFTIYKINNLLNIGLFLMMIKGFFSSSNILPYNDYVDTVLNVVSVVCLTIVSVKKFSKLSHFLLYGFSGLIVIYSASLSGNYIIVITFITIFALIDVDINYILKFLFKYQVIFLAFHVFYSLLLYVIIDTPIYIYSQGIYKVHFGFQHPNTLAIYFFNLIALWIWLNYEKLKLKHYMYILILQSLVYYCTRSETAVISTVALLILISASKFKIFKKAIDIIARFIVPLLTIFYLYLILNYSSSNDIISGINELLTGRVKLSAFAYENLGFSFLGQFVPETLGQWDPEWQMSVFKFDNVYIYSAVEIGFIWIVLVSVVFYLLSKKGDSKINSFIIIWSFYGMTEVHGLNGYQLFIILLVSLLFSKTTKYSYTDNKIKNL